MKCKTCGQEITDKVAIEQLEARVRQLESDLLAEQMKPKEIHFPAPITPSPTAYPPCWERQTWIAPHTTGTPIPREDIVTCLIGL